MSTKLSVPILKKEQQQNNDMDLGKSNMQPKFQSDICLIYVGSLMAVQIETMFSNAFSLKAVYLYEMNGESES